MSHFSRLPEFGKEFGKLSKKYSSLSRDLSNLEDVLKTFPTGSGKNFTIIHSSTKTKVVKTRLACKSLRDRSMRIIYAYHDVAVAFVYIEIYFKGDKESEERGRIKEYLKRYQD